MIYLDLNMLWLVAIQKIGVDKTCDYNISSINQVTHHQDEQDVWRISPNVIHRESDSEQGIQVV